jgi:hypothetical protein
MTHETSIGKRQPIEPEAVETIRRLIARGVEVVVVSNSGTERICQMLSGVGLKPVPHEAGVTSSLRVRGGARKFWLGDQSDCLVAGPYAVEVDRPLYRQILEEEKPDIVVGDVFSLDLALPVALASQRQAGLAELRAILRRRPYTPKWSQEFLLHGIPEEVNRGIIDRMDELLELA